ncbi:NUDIX domain-containing protein [Roseovarius sp. D22-M7]|uniref:NUDIX domain-containing protein n=1 Tax=Roseovarius sp. D22-M7 TaxID=3127116 RepID=UPI00300F917A
MPAVAPLFLYGPMAARSFLQVAIGAAADRAAEALLPDHRLSAPADAFPLPGLAQGSAGVHGRIIEDPEAIKRLIYTAEALRLGPLQSVRVHRGARDLAAWAFSGAHGERNWLPERWSTTSQRTLDEAVREIVGDMAERPVAELAATKAMILSRAAARVAARDSAPTDLRSSFRADAVETERVEIPHAGFFRTRCYSLRHPHFDGNSSPLLRREVFVATDAALVLPYDPAHDRLLLVEQFRMGPYGRGDPHPWMLEPVAGRIDAGEAPEDTAFRECREEAGLELRALERISSHYCTPGYSTEVFHLFLGICDLPDLAQGSGGLATENEDIRTHVIGFDRAMDLLQTGEANNGPLILALIWLQRERARLRTMT